MSKMTIEVIEENVSDDVLELTMRGTPEKVIQLLAQGAAKEDLLKIAEAFQREIDKRR